MARTRGVIGTFLTAAAEHPGRSAIRTSNDQLSYRDLELRAGGVVRRLTTTREGPTLLLASNGIDLTVGGLGVLGAGRTVVPADPRSGPDRLAELVDAVGATAILWSDAAFSDRLVPTTDAAKMTLSNVEPAPLTPVPVDDGAPAVLGSTSGSTGPPRFFAEQHRSILRRMGRTDDTSPSPGETLGMLLGATHSAVKRILNVLLLGGTVSCFDARSDPMSDIVAGFAAHRVSYLKMIPTYLRRLCEAADGEAAMPSLRVLATSGESLHWSDVALARQRLSPTCAVRQTYGATETGRIAVGFVAPTVPIGEGPVPVGRPVPPLRVWIEDEDGRPADTGRAGEIVVDAPDLAAEVVAEDLPSGWRRYRTGDLGRFLLDGQLTVVGRADRRVKMGGIRIEPARIERVLRELDGISEVAVVPSSSEDGQPEIVAHLGSVPNKSGFEGELRRHVERNLHPAAVPARVVWHTAGLPTLPNGKVDTATLAGW